MIGSSPGVQTALKVAEQVASSGGHVLLMGEPGVGKRLMARLIHDRSPRALRPFGQFSCEGFRERVVDGELFGREAGSGSDARDGLLKLCHRGTLVIDEISKLPAKSQEHLIKCMILNSVRPIGSRSSSAPSDVRIIATTSTDLNEAVRSSDFVRELFDRISGAQAVLAPLRERRSDIPMLADHFVRRAGSRLGKKFKGITSDGLDRLMRHPWPGNVRELEEMVNQSTSRASGPWLAAEDLPALPDALGPSGIAPGATIQEIEKEAITRTLDLVGGSTSRAAQILNMSVRKIQYKLKEYRREAASALRSETVRSLPPQPQPVPTAKTKTTVFVADGEDA
jgi:DNA-binding NtrC family response regulator